MTRSWRAAGLLWIALCVALIVAYRHTWQEMVNTWSHTESYTHGPLVPLISAWLIWRIRAQVMGSTSPTYCGWGAIALAAAVTLWALGDILQISAARHFAIVGMLLAAFLLVFGVQVFWALFFPLMFVFFAVPFGEFLTVPMMEQTADFTVMALQWTGVPVYREARYLQIPSGNWSVVEACSGMRYLIASIMLGALFAYLFYRSWQKRALFVLASIVVPIVGNWLRAYMIVMIGHLTNNKYGVGADHIMFGWVFFGVLIYIMFSIGARWREDDDQAPATTPIASPSVAAKLDWARAAVVTALACVVPWLVTLTYSNPTLAKPLVTPEIAGWSAVPAAKDAWRPHQSGARTETHELISAPSGERVNLYRGVYAAQRGLSRMIRHGNELIPEAFVGESSVKSRSVALKHAGAGQNAYEFEMREQGQQRVSRGTYVVGGTANGSAYWSKLALARAQLTGRGDASMVVVWSAAAREAETARATLDAFEAKLGPRLIEPSSQ